MNKEENRDILDRIQIGTIDRHLRNLLGYEKLTGEPGAAKGARYICSQLEDNGIPYTCLSFEALLSNPLEGILTVEGEDIVCRPRSFSGACEGLEAELAADPKAPAPESDGPDRMAFFAGVRGKIVVGYGYDERYAKLLESYGAAGWIQVWKSDESLIHEDTVGPVWGTPDMDSRFLLSSLPVAGVNKETGERLMEKIRGSEGGIKGRLTLRVTREVKEVFLPVAEIPGASEDFVLLSCHYDTWYEGAFDNTTANAAALEIARVLNQVRDRLKRSVRIAWWPGHSNGRYMGSAWYCDNYFRELREHCLASLNSDLIGVRDVDILGVKTTGGEGEDFLRQVAEQALPGIAVRRQAIIRGADQSFFGADIPYHINPRLEKKERRYATPGPGGDFWHTPEDTYDKVDLDNLKKDADFLGLMTYVMASEEKLPLDADGYFGLWMGRLKEIAEKTESEEELEPVFLALDETKKAFLRALEKAADSSERERLIKKTLGTLNRLFQSSGSPYGQDTAFAYGHFHLLGESLLAKKGKAAPEVALYYRTTFVRQRNRMVCELEELVKKLGGAI